ASNTQAPETGNEAPAQETGSESRPAQSLTAEMNAEIDAAMREMEAAGAAAPPPSPHAHDPKPVQPASARGPAHIRGPRVVQAGREHRTGKVITVGPTDVFVEFGPKELGIVPRIQFPADQLPVKDQELQVVEDKFEA